MMIQTVEHGLCGCRVNANPHQCLQTSLDSHAIKYRDCELSLVGARREGTLSDPPATVKNLGRALHRLAQIQPLGFDLTGPEAVVAPVVGAVEWFAAELQSATVRVGQGGLGGQRSSRRQAVERIEFMLSVYPGSAIYTSIICLCVILQYPIEVEQYMHEMGSACNALIVIVLVRRLGQ